MTMKTIEEVCALQRENNCSEMYLRLKGTFWKAYDGAAFAIARITGYQIKKLKTVDRYELGFPERALDRVLVAMEQGGLALTSNEEGLIAFTGGDPTIDPALVYSEETERVVDTTADYRALCRLRKELLDINLADETLTLAMLAGMVRNLQIQSLAHLSL